MRTYRTGSRWAFWRWTVTDSEYLTRLFLVHTPVGSICLHWIHKPDPEPYLHDHPVSFFSVILRGWYTEWRAKGNGQRHLRSHYLFNFIRASENDRHTIALVYPHTLTLAFMGPKRREWGFHTPAGWIYWRDYYRAQRANNSATKEA